MFQYSLSLLDAFSALPTDRYSVAAAYTDPAWQPYLTERGIPAEHIGTKKGECKSWGWWWSKLCLPLWLWRAVYWRMDKTARFFAESDMDYWLFPAQDHWTYLSRVLAIGTIHDLMHRYESNFPEVSIWGRYFLREYRFRNICRAALAILVDSETGKTHVRESYDTPAEKIYPLPYVPPHYIYIAQVPEDFDTRYTLPAKYFFYPAQFWPHKNHIRLLQAMAKVRQDCPGIHLVLAGSKHHTYYQVRREAERLRLEHAVSFVGYLPDMYLPEFYRRAHALVMPTFFGPTNIPPLEAMALGCPVIISGTYGMPEQLGDAACFIEPASVDSIAHALKTLWNDETYCTSLIEKGRARARQWKQEDFSRRLQEIIRGIAA